MEETLRPCPFCGAKAEIVRNGSGSYFVRCTNRQCAAKTRLYHENENGARMAWNRRAERTCHIKLSKTSVWHCDGCGQTIDGNCFADNGGRLTEYRYCPKCGARAVNE